MLVLIFDKRCTSVPPSSHRWKAGGTLEHSDHIEHIACRKFVGRMSESMYANTLCSSSLFGLKKASASADDDQ